MEFDREKMLQDIDDSTAPLAPVLPYETTSVEMMGRWGCSRATAYRRLEEDERRGVYETRLAKQGKSNVRVWWKPRWKEAWEASQREEVL